MNKEEEASALAWWEGVRRICWNRGFGYDIGPMPRWQDLIES